MKEQKMTMQLLRERQGWTLDQKVDHALGTIEAFVNRVGGVNKVYVSFSGGKDSTVLFHLARRLYPDILGVFCNTGNEYPDIIRFVRKTQAEGANIQIIRPKLTPRSVWTKYVFPLVGKDIARYIHDIRSNPDSKSSKLRLSKDTRFGISDKWKYLIAESYSTHNICCHKLKEEPMRYFGKKSGRYPIIGVMASESKRRECDYVKNGGCNYFEAKEPKSQPLSIWLEDDIWAYIDRFNLPIAEIYHKGAQRTGCMGCGFGAQFADDTRFQVLYDNYPKCYDMVMNYTNNGVTFREALRKALAVNGLYLPDEQPPTLFDELK